MRLDYKHQLTCEEAYTRITGLLERLQIQYAGRISNCQRNWNPKHNRMDYSLTMMGFSTKGCVNLTDGHIILEGKIPLAARVFSGKIEKMFRKELDALLS